MSVNEISGQIIDPYIVGATVCCDKNTNHVCDSDEVSVLSETMVLMYLKIVAANANIAVGGFDSVTNIQNNLQKVVFNN